MTATEWIEKARQLGLLKEGVEMGLVNPAKLRQDEIRRYFQVLRRSLKYDEAIAQTSIDMRVSDGYVRKIVTGNV